MLDKKLVASALQYLYSANLLPAIPGQADCWLDHLLNAEPSDGGGLSLASDNDVLEATRMIIGEYERSERMKKINPATLGLAIHKIRTDRLKNKPILSTPPDDERYIPWLRARAEHIKSGLSTLEAEELAWKEVDPKNEKCLEHKLKD